MQQDSSTPVHHIVEREMLTYPWPTMASCFMLENNHALDRGSVTPATRQAQAGEGRGTRRYSLAHAQHSVNLGDTQPVKDIRHQGLEAHVLYTGNVLGALEIVRCKICPALSRVVHNCRTFSVSLSSHDLLRIGEGSWHCLRIQRTVL